MNDAAIRALVWAALAVHVLAGGAVLRHKAPVALLVFLNLVVAAAVLLYWGRRWFTYLFRGVTWYATDQLVPACALLVLVLAILNLAGRYQGAPGQWVIFVADTIALLCAALFFTFFRMTRLF